jgi:peptidoglycan/LPS O-acetylase OafA/YrhL
LSPSHYQPHIDGLRAIAVIVVLIYHLDGRWLPGGFVGVDLFFVISGYVVTASLMAQTAASFSSFLAGFYARRLTRIMPAMLCMLLATGLASVLFIPKAWLSEFTDQVAIAAYIGLSNLWLAHHSEGYFGTRADFNPFVHTWSLGVEEQFYLIAPILIFAMIRAISQKQTQRFWIGFGILVALAVASLLYLRATQSHAQPHAFYSPLARFWQLATGVLLCLYVRGTQSVGGSMPTQTLAKSYQGLATIPAWVGLGMLGLSLSHPHTGSFPWPAALLPTLAAVLLIGVQGAIGRNRWVERCLSARTMVTIGLRSYSLYLWHWPVFVLMRWTVGLTEWYEKVAAVLLATACAELSYRWIESPLRQSSTWNRWPAWVRIVTLLAVTAAAMGLGILLFKQRDNLSLSTVNRNASEWISGHRMTGLPENRRCQVDMESVALPGTQVIRYVPKACTLPSALAAAKLFVLGDSHAGAYLPLFDQLAAEQGFTIHVYQHGGCPFIDLFQPVVEGPAHCVPIIQAWVADVTGQLRSGDLVYLPSLRVARLSDQWVTLPTSRWETLMYSAPFRAKREHAERDAIENWLRPWTQRGAQILFDYPKPVFPSPPMRCSDVFNRSNDVCRGGLTIARDAAEVMRAPTVNSIDRLRALDPLIQAWDPLPALCGVDRCDATVTGIPNYFDGDHLSAAGNRRVYPAFRDAVCRQVACR